MVTVNMITEAGTTPLAETGLRGYEVLEASTKFSVSEVSSARLKVPYSSKIIGVLTGGFSPVVEILEDDRRLFIGSVSAWQRDIFGSVDIELDGAMSWLGDIVKEPFTVNNRTHDSYVRVIVDQYNAAKVAAGETIKQINVGAVLGWTGNVNFIHEDEYTNTLELVKECVETYGGYILESPGSGGVAPSFSWLKEPITRDKKVIEFGVNTVSLTDRLDFSDFASRVYGIGKDRIRNSTGYFRNENAERIYGRRDYGYRSDAETQAELDRETQVVLAEKSVPIRTIELTALELERLGMQYSNFICGMTARAIEPNLGIDTDLIVSSVERDLINHNNSVITLGRTVRGIVDYIRR